MSIQTMGWNEQRNESFAPYRAQGYEPARITGQDRERYDVIDDHGEWSAEVSGRLRHEARTPEDFPAVGDWVALRPHTHDGPRTIVAVLPRLTVFTRKQAGRETVAQVVAANVDTAFVVAALDRDFNLRRLERYLSTVWDGGASPVVVLNKMDLSDEIDERIAEVDSIAPGVPVVAVSALEARGLDSLAPWLTAGSTVVLIGSSGVGKSTLVNALLGEERQTTGAVREWDSRGRHTTTRRELVPLEGGAWLLDTPGIKELQLWIDEETLGDSFPEIAALAAECRFRDCRHVAEPGCAVQAALKQGTLPQERLASWSKLQREAAWLAAKQDQRLKAEQEARWRAVRMEHRRRTQQSPKR